MIQRNVNPSFAGISKSKHCQISARKGLPVNFWQLLRIKPTNPAQIQQRCSFNDFLDWWVLRLSTYYSKFRENCQFQFFYFPEQFLWGDFPSYCWKVAFYFVAFNLLSSTLSTVYCISFHIFSNDKLCYNCKKPGHVSKDCKEENGENSKMLCFKCNQVGHMARSCPNVADNSR